MIPEFYPLAHPINRERINAMTEQINLQNTVKVEDVLTERGKRYGKFTGHAFGTTRTTLRTFATSQGMHNWSWTEC